MITTSEIKTSVVIDEKYMELAVRALHKAFEPGRPQAPDQRDFRAPRAETGCELG
jgi:hypothetical protein